MRILVTGGAGYVGSHCVRGLCGAGHEVTIYDDLVHGGHREAVDRRAKLVVADLADAMRLDGAFAEGRFEAVMHFAASAEVGENAGQSPIFEGGVALSCEGLTLCATAL